MKWIYIHLLSVGTVIMNWIMGMTNLVINWIYVHQQFVGGVAVGSVGMALLLRWIHVHKRRSQNACICGERKMSEVTFFMYASPIQHDRKNGRIHVVSHAFKRCKGGHLNHRQDARWMSVTAWNARQKRHPEQFEWTRDIQLLFEELRLGFPPGVVAFREGKTFRAKPSVEHVHVAIPPIRQNAGRRVPLILMKRTQAMRIKAG